MNTYKYKAYMEIKKNIATLKNGIDDKQAVITKKKNEITELEKEIIEDEKRLQLAVDFKNELEGECTQEADNKSAELS